MSKKFLKIFIIIVVLVFICCIFFIRNCNDFLDTVKYNSKNYILLEYNLDIFTYNHNSNVYYEEDIIHPISHKKWDIVYFNGDLFVLDKQVKYATKYYSDDKNYNWFISFDNDDNVIKESISISKDEILYLYNLVDMEKNKTIIFDDIDRFVDVLKISKDDLVFAIINLVQVDGIWYYKTEIMTDDDREYVIEIPDSLNDKINEILK